MTINNFSEARQSRKKIIEMLKKQQEVDSYCSLKLGQIGLDGKRKLLELLAKWLVSFGPGRQADEQEQACFCAARLSLNDWLSVQRRETALCDELAQAIGREDEAYKLYDHVAPLGLVSILLLSKGEKAKAQRLKNDYESAKASRELLDVELHKLREVIQRTIRSFLTAAVTPECVQVFATESSIREELSRLMQELEKKGLDVWKPNSNEQQTSLTRIEQETKELREFYQEQAVGGSTPLC